MKQAVLLSIILLISWPLLASRNDVPPAKPVTPPAKQAETSGDNSIEARETGSRGQLLYQNHCTVCHESNLHIRQKSKAKTLADINKWVNHWSQQSKLDWSATDIEDVVNYLNQTYYQYVK